MQIVWKISEIRKGERHDPLGRSEMNNYRQLVGKLSWLAQGTRPYLDYSVSAMSRKNNTDKIVDLHKVYKVLKMVKAK